MELRNYQERAVEWAYSLEEPQCVVQLPTRMGKSIIISELAKKFSNDSYLVVVLTNKSALIDQLDKHISQIAEEPNIVKAGKHRTTDSNIWLIMEQSFHKDSKFREEFEGLKAFAPVMVLKDEISIGYHGKRYNEIISFLKPEKIVGFDATPIDNMARAIMPKHLIKSFADVKYAIEHKYWKKPIYIIPRQTQELNLDEIRTTSTGDFDTTELSITMQNPGFIVGVLQSIKQKFGTKKKWIIYTVDINHAEMVIHLVKQYLTSAVGVVHSKKSEAENQTTIKQFKEDEPPQSLTEEPIDVLVSVMSLTIGFDAPIADGIINFRPTNVLKLWHQFGSRANTPYPNKDKAYIIDAGLCSVRLGLLEEPLIMLEPNATAKEYKKAIQERRKDNIIEYFELYDKEIEAEQVVLLEKQYEEETNNIYKMDIDKLIFAFKAERDFWRALEIGLEIWNRVGNKRYSWEWFKKQTEKAFDFDAFEYNFNALTRKVKDRMRAIIRGDVESKFGSIPYYVNFLLNEMEFSYVYKTPIYRENIDDKDEEDDAILYQCINCDYIGKFKEFENTEYDGDILGTCPECKKHTIIIEVEEEDDDGYELPKIDIDGDIIPF